MLQNPRLKQHYRVEFLDQEHVLLRSETENTLLCGTLYNKVLTKLSEHEISAIELVTQLSDQLTAIEIFGTLQVLEEKGYLTEACPTLPDEFCAYWNSLGIEPAALLEVLAKNAIAITSLSTISDEAFQCAFDSIGLKKADSGILQVIITDDYDRDELRQINRDALATKQSWMLVKPTGRELWIGPIFVPEKTGCWECLVQRLRYNRQAYKIYMPQDNNRLFMPLSNISLSSHAVANITALEIIKWLYFGKNENIEGRIFSVDTRSLKSCSHVLVRRPQCRVCGNTNGQHRFPESIILNKNLSYCPVTLGGYREVPPEVTIEKYEHHVSSITGVVQKLEPYYKTPGTPVYNYFSSQMVILQKISPSSNFNPTFRSGCGGKGKTPSQAKAGALCEALERYSAMEQGDEMTTHGSLRELSPDAIHPNAYMNYSQAQYDNRETINKSCYRVYDMIPQPFDDSSEIDWAPVYSLTHQKFRYLPKSMCYLEIPVKDLFHTFWYPDSNGMAAGNSIEEAILQGFLEVVERDCVALWWYNMIQKPAVDFLSFNEPYFYQLVEYFNALDRSLYVLDLTADLGIPVFGAISYRLDSPRQDIVFGFGAHVDAKIAVERALLELNQILPGAGVIGGDSTEGKLSIQDQGFFDWLYTATIENQPYLLPQDNVPEKHISDYPQLCQSNVYDSVKFCVDTAAKHGLETLVLDMTRPDIGLNVVRVFVPGLRHFWKRLAPGRLYDVPVEMGWLEKPRQEEELNPIGLFI